MKNSDDSLGLSFLKSRWTMLKRSESPKAQGVPAPPLQDPAPKSAELIPLPPMPDATLAGMELTRAIESRISRRRFSDEAISRKELAYLLWASQGVRKEGKSFSFRTVPSGGARHPFETYLSIQRVDGIRAGLYRYLPFDHALCSVRFAEDLRAYEKELDTVMLSHNFGAAVSFLWVAAPERCQWSYEFEAHRLMLLDAGHICQNLYLACEGLGLGTCAVGAYDQDACDRFLGLDGTNRFLLYAAPVGKPLSGVEG